MVFCPKPRSSM